jgi:hypothetical protein
MAGQEYQAQKARPMSESKRWFHPLKGASKRRSIVAIDIEGTGGPPGFVCGAVVGDDFCKFFTDRESMYKTCLSLASESHWLFSHNLEYDLPILEGPLFPSLRLLYTRTRVLWAKGEYWGQPVALYDSTNLFPRMGIKYLGSLVNLPKLSVSDYIMNRLSQGYQWHQFTASEQAIIREYCIRDATILNLAVNSLQELVLSLGGQLQPTIAGVAMDVYRRGFLKHAWPALGVATNKLCRPAFYGGRVENFAMGKVPGVSMYDVTSLYPYAQDITRFPHPDFLSLDIGPKYASSILKHEGVISCTITAPESFIPCLPHRFDKRLFFPYGKMSGSWTLLELRYALDHGCTLDSIDWILWSRVSFNPFHEFIETLFARRQAYLYQSSGNANLVKLILNSLYGRWGLNPEGGLYELKLLTPEMTEEDLYGFETRAYNDKLYAYGPVESTHQPDYVNVMFAAQITSQARIILQDELIVQGEKAVYCDTDSIITRGTVPVREGLGAWRQEMSEGTADLVGPKEYRIHNDVLGDKYVCKGIPERVMQEYFETGVARFFRALGVREALRKGLEPATWVQTLKNHRTVFPKRWPTDASLLRTQAWCQTRPYQVSELPLVCLGKYLPGDVDYPYPWQVYPVLPSPQQAKQLGF